MFKSYGKFWKNYVNFEGKSNRPDYWFAFLMNTLIILIGLILLGLGISSSGNVNVHGSYFNFESSGLNAFASCMLALLVIFVVATIIPDISITVRRLRDAGYHWAFIFLELIPWIGKIVLIVLLCMPTSEDDTNMFTAHKRVNPDELEKWYKLKEEGVITPEEYETKKKDLL